MLQPNQIVLNGLIFEEERMRAKNSQKGNIHHNALKVV